MLPRGLKRSLRLIFASLPVRILTLSVLKLLEYSGRTASALRTAAYFPRAKNLTCHWSVKIKEPRNITFGEGVVIGPGSNIGAAAPVVIGDYVRIAAHATIETGGLDFSTPPPCKHLSKPITLERGVWVGAGAMILAGVTIGEYSMIAAGAVVRKSVKPNSLVVGAQVQVQQMDALD